MQAAELDRGQTAAANETTCPDSQDHVTYNHTRGKKETCNPNFAGRTRAPAKGRAESHHRQHEVARFSVRECAPLSFSAESQPTSYPGRCGGDCTGLASTTPNS